VIEQLYLIFFLISSFYKAIIYWVMIHCNTFTSTSIRVCHSSNPIVSLVQFTTKQILTLSKYAELPTVSKVPSSSSQPVLHRSPTVQIFQNLIFNASPPISSATAAKKAALATFLQTLYLLSFPSQRLSKAFSKMRTAKTSSSIFSKLNAHSGAFKNLPTALTS
jgi:hypothetical protein